MDADDLDDGEATTSLRPVPRLHGSLGEETRSSGIRALSNVAVLPKHPVCSSSWSDSGHIDERGQGKWPQDKNISGLASPNPCVVWGKGAAAICIQEGTCHPPRHPAVKGRAIFPIQLLENPAAKS